MSDLALQFIKKHEGCRLKAYRDAAGILTCGWGCTGPDIHADTIWSQDQADARLASAISNAKAAVKRLTSVSLTDGQEAALTSFVFNVGESAFASSTLLSMLHRGNIIGAAQQFPRWDHAGGHELKGLLIRRFEEALLFLKDV